MRTKFISLILLVLATFTTCDEQLDLKPQGVLTDLNFYQTEADFEAASLSPYSTLLNLYYDQFGRGWYQTQLYPDDDVTTPQNTNNNQEDFLWIPSNGEFGYLWDQSYKGINRANTILYYLPLAENFADEAAKPRFEAEARFIRAYFNFILVTNFGNVPLATKLYDANSLSESLLPNSQPGEVWNLVVEDLTFAKQNLPASWSGTNVGRATSGAATALLGKTYLYRAQWENNPAFYASAITEFTTLVDKYSLTPVFEDNFDVTKENNPESVFEVQFSPGGPNPWLPVDFYDPNNPGNDIGAAGTGRQIFWKASCGPNNTDCAPGANGQGYGQVHITPGLQNEFEPGDPRRPATIYLAGDDYAGTSFKSTWSITGSTPAKYIRKDASNASVPFNRSVNNDRVIRYADVLLMLAEAELLGNNNVARAAELINQVRRRTDPTGTILPDRPASVSITEMFTFLQHERRVELALEGHRYNDLVRWHRANLIDIQTNVDFGRETANQNWSEQNLIKPVPQRELDLNGNLTQNPEYQ